jgi:hypothetical protein
VEQKYRANSCGSSFQSLINNTYLGPTSFASYETDSYFDNRSQMAVKHYVCMYLNIHTYVGT